jgi:hypothetical protein
VPHVKLPQIEPVINTTMLIINPMGDNDLEIVKDVGDLNTRPMMLLMPIEKKINRDNQAAGTWINIILKEIP